MVSNPRFVEMPQPLGLFAGDLFKRGIEYLDAFEFLNKDREQFQFAGCFLFAHSLELLLKSFLAAHEVTKHEIRYVLRHDLPEILKRCKEYSFPFVAYLDQYAAHTFEMNKDFDFRYPSGFVLTMPRPAECAPIARGLAAAIQPIVFKASKDANLKFASETRIHKGKKIRWSD